MKRLDIRITDNMHDVLDMLKEKTERSKTELIHDAVGLLWLAEKAYAEGHMFAEVDQKTGEVVSRLHMPMFEFNAEASPPAPDDHSDEQSIPSVTSGRSGA